MFASGQRQVRKVKQRRLQRKQGIEIKIDVDAFEN